MQSDNNQRVKKFYVYGHYTQDSDNLFYIGVGTINNLKSKRINIRYARAYHFNNRTKFWKNIKCKHGIVVKILYHFDTKKESLIKERELISKFGRRILGGKLCNLTSGGEVGPTDYHPIRSEKTRKILSEIRSITLYLYDSNGIFIKECKTIKSAADFCNVTYNAIHSCLQTKNFSNGYFIFKDFKGQNLGYTKNDLNFKSPLSKKVITENLETKEIILHNSIYECASYLETNRQNLRRAIKAQRPCKKHKVYFERRISSQDSKAISQE